MPTKDNKSQNSVLAPLAEHLEPVVKHLYGASALAQSIPALGLIVTSIKAFQGYSDAIFANKVHAFLTSPAISLIDATKFKNRYLDDGEKDEELANVLLMSINAATDLKKPALLAQFFTAYLYGNIDRENFLLIVHAISSSSIIDLEKFIACNRIFDSDQAWIRRLAGPGLFSTSTMVFAGNNGSDSTRYKITSLGEVFLSVIESN